MKTETHYKLALSICDRFGLTATTGQRSAFVCGCVTPDLNPFSYLKGVRIRAFHGHDWQNAKGFILSAVERLMSGGLGYYGLGVLTHYLCDAFTYTHNTKFSGTLGQHNKYEKRLHSFVLQSANRFEYQPQIIGSLSDFILNIHRRYDETPVSYSADADFISLAVGNTMTEFGKYQKLRSGAEAVNELRCAERYTSRP